MLVLGNNYLVMFVGWEGVGLCSYLLIGFYYDQAFPPTRARRRSSSTASATSPSWSACSPDRHVRHAQLHASIFAADRGGLRAW